MAIKFESNCDECVHNYVCAFKNDFENEKNQVNKLTVFTFDITCHCKHFWSKKSNYNVGTGVR